MYIIPSRDVHISFASKKNATPLPLSSCVKIWDLYVSIYIFVSKSEKQKNIFRINLDEELVAFVLSLQYTHI